MAAAVAGAKDHPGGTVAQVASHLLLAGRHAQAHGGDAEAAVGPAIRREVVECEPVGVGDFDPGRVHTFATDRVAEHSQSALVDLKRPCCAGVALFAGIEHEADRAPADLHELSAAEGDHLHDPASVGVGQVIVDLEPIVADPAELLIADRELRQARRMGDEPGARAGHGAVAARARRASPAHSRRR